MSQKSSPSVQELLEKMKNNGDCTRQFEEALTEFVNVQENDAQLQQLLKHEDQERSYLGLYGMCIYLRRLLQYDDMERLLREYRARHEKNISLGHLETLYHIDSGEYYSLEEMENCLQQAYNVAESYRKTDNPQNPANVAGTQHAFADLLITFCERYEEHQELLLQKWGRKAKDALEKAMSLSTYAKYFCTKGRLQALQNDYINAQDSIHKAIRLETPTGNASRYSLRIMQYQSHLVRIQARGEIHRLNLQQAQMTEEVEKIRGSLMNNVEIIAFFSGIISFVIGSLTLANGSTPGDAAGLIIILLGALLTVFNSFSLLLHPDKKTTTARIIIFAVGALCIAGGLILVL